MPQSENNFQSSGNAILKTMLHKIALKPDLKSIAPDLLAEACSGVGAASGFYLVFDDPRELYTHGIEAELIPADNWLLERISKLETDFQVQSDVPSTVSDSYTSWLLAPVRRKTTMIAVLALFFVEEPHLSDDLSSILVALLDGLTIVTRTTKEATRHAKLSQNQNEFVRIVSHDLRSPLTSIKGFASMLESNTMGELSDKQMHFVEKILSGVGQMTSLVDNIQDAGRYDPETGFYEMQRSPTDLISIVDNIVKNHLVPAEKEELTLTVNAEPDIPIVNVDAAMIERSIINLVDNAIKYTPNGGKIEVGVRKDGDSIIITISDNGFGISDENLTSLFKRHFRIRRREHKRVKGSGLGLFIVRSVARHHDGDAFVDSVEGEGSTFGIRIPLRGENLLGTNFIVEPD